MPTQVAVLGVTVTLLSVLLVHLLFTVRYHFPLSKLNYIFQAGAVLFSLGRTVGELHVLFANLATQPLIWPYGFLYIEVTLPPTTWTQAILGTWLGLSAMSNLTVHATHIQFLTMLFPSALEARLIIGLLGPLAIMASFLNFTALSTVPAVNDLGDAIRNTANSTLTLLYTLAIMIWGFTLNRTRAWRTDGGTAAFGALALVLGVSGTAVNFLEVKEDRMRWLPGVVECVLLWQSWMGFWWWVGAGMWTGEAEDVERKERRASRKEEKKRRRRETAAALVAAVTPSASASARTVGSARRRAHAAEEEIEMDDLRPSLLHPDTAQGDRQVPHLADSNESVSSGSTPPLVPHVLDPILHFVRPFLARLRLAHDRAVVEGAAQPPGLPDHVRRGWGIRALMMRGRRERGERRAGVGRGEGGGGEVGAGERRAGFEGDGGEQLEEWEDDSEASDDERLSGPSRAEEEERPGAETEPDWRGHGMDGEQSWTWRGAIGRRRLKDVQHY